MTAWAYEPVREIRDLARLIKPALGELQIRKIGPLASRKHFGDNQAGPRPDHWAALGPGKAETSRRGGFDERR